MRPPATSRPTHFAPAWHATPLALEPRRVAVAVEGAPPRHALVLVQTPLVARGHELQDPQEEQAEVGAVEVELLEEELQRLDHLVGPRELLPREAVPGVA